jgi:hypothetical protein
MKSFSRRVSAIALLLCARTMFADPITGLTRWIHRSMTQAGSDIVPVLVIIGALIGMAKGWMGDDRWCLARICHRHHRR